MSLLSFQEGHKAEEAADWHCQELRLCLWTSHTALLQIWISPCPHSLSASRGSGFPGEPGSGLSGRVAADTWVFSFIKKDQEGKWFPLPVLGYHTLPVPGFGAGCSLLQVLGKVYPGEGTRYKTTPPCCLQVCIFTLFTGSSCYIPG